MCIEETHPEWLGCGCGVLKALVANLFRERMGAGRTQSAHAPCEFVEGEVWLEDPTVFAEVQESMAQVSAGASAERCDGVVQGGL
jgi:hypothetical protein